MTEPELAPFTTDWRRVSALSLTVDEEPRDTASIQASSILLGRLVHRLFHARVPADDQLEAISARATRLLRPEERIGPEDTRDVCHRAATLFRQLAARAELRALLDSGTCLFEVPFSLRVDGEPGVIVRGTIDCFVLHPDGSLTIVEFKTGVPRPAHERQLALYVEAARALFPDTPVSGRIFHASGV